MNIHWHPPSIIIYYHLLSSVIIYYHLLSSIIYLSTKSKSQVMFRSFFEVETIDDFFPWKCWWFWCPNFLWGDVPEPESDAANYVNRAPIPAFHFLRRLAGALPVKICEPLAKKVQEKIPTRHYLWDVCSMINKVWPDITFHSEAGFPLPRFFKPN